MPLMTEPEKQTRPTADVQLGARIRAAREQKGWSRVEAAEIAGVGEQYLYRVEQGRQGITLDRVHALALAWGVDPPVLDQRLGSIRSTSSDASGPCPATLTLEIGPEGAVTPASLVDRRCLDTLGPLDYDLVLSAARKLGAARESLGERGTRTVAIRLAAIRGKHPG